MHVFFLGVQKIAHCYRLNVCVSPKSDVDILIPRVIVLKGGALGGDSVMRTEPSQMGLVPS